MKPGQWHKVSQILLTWLGVTISQVASLQDAHYAVFLKLGWPFILLFCRLGWPQHSLVVDECDDDDDDDADADADADDAADAAADDDDWLSHHH